MRRARAHDPDAGLDRLPDELRVANCAACGALLIGTRVQDWELARGVDLSDRPLANWWRDSRGRPVCGGCG